MKRLASLQESDEESGDGTAKAQKERIQETVSSASGGFFTATSEWRNSVAQSRLSSMFDSWMSPSSSGNTVSSPPTSPERKKVSEPKLISHDTGGSIDMKTSPDLSDSQGVNSADFEHMLVGS